MRGKNNEKGPSMESEIAFLIAVCCRCFVIGCILSALLCQEDQTEYFERAREGEYVERAPEPTAPVESSVIIEQNMTGEKNGFRVENDNFDLPPTYEEFFEKG